MNAQQTCTWTARTAVRIPRDDGSELAESARQRLARPAGVVAVEITALEGVNPGLSATLVTVTVHADVKATAPAAVREQLVTAPGVESVESVEQL